MADRRKFIVKAAHRAVAENSRFDYTEGAKRMAYVHAPWHKPRIDADCSSGVTYWYSWSWAPDPNGFNFNGSGYTGSLLEHGVEVTVEHVQPGDAVIYGPGTGWHVGCVVEVHGRDILTVSHGQQGDPHYVWTNRPSSVPSRGFGWDGRQPQRFLRFHTFDRRKPPKPTPEALVHHVIRTALAPPGAPSGVLQSARRVLQRPAPSAPQRPDLNDLASAGLTELPGASFAELASLNGYTVYFWDSARNEFRPSMAGLKAGTTQYAPVGYGAKKA